MGLYAVIGLGVYGLAVAQELERQGHGVIAVDTKQSKVDEIAAKKQLANPLKVDASNRDSLIHAGVSDKCEAGIVAIGEMIEPSIMATFNLASIGITNIIVKAKNSAHEEILKKVGATRVVFPEKESGRRAVQKLLSSNILEEIKFSKDYDITKIVSPDKLIGHTIGEIDFRKKYKANIIAVQKGTDLSMEISPGPDYLISIGDILYVIVKKGWQDYLSSDE